MRSLFIILGLFFVKSLFSGWQIINMGNPADFGAQGISIGDADNDTMNEIYAGCALSGFQGRMYQYKWDGSNWIQAVISVGSPPTRKSIAIGDGNNDGEKEIYITCDSASVYQLKYAAGSWVKTVVDSLSNVDQGGIAVGDGNRDGINEVYVAGGAYQYKWDGSSWVRSGMGVDGVDVIVADGDNDEELEVYIASGYTYQCIYRLVPKLIWTGEPGFTTDGVEPDTGESGSMFEFRVCYIDSNEFRPIIKELQVDLNDNGQYEAWEKFSTKEADTTDTIFIDGKNYYYAMPVNYAGDGLLNYRFIFKNVIDWAEGEPVIEHTFVVLSPSVEEKVAGSGKSYLWVSPNPFRREIVMSYSSGSRLMIHDICGRVIRDFSIKKSNYPY